MNHVSAIESLLTPGAEESSWTRLPGLFRKWEFEQIVDIGHAYCFEEAGSTEDGTPLIAIYVRDEPPAEEC